MHLFDCFIVSRISISLTKCWSIGTSPFEDSLSLFLIPLSLIQTVSLRKSREFFLITKNHRYGSYVGTTREEFDALWRTLDSDHSNSIEWDEFRNFLKRSKLFDAASSVSAMTDKGEANVASSTKGMLE